MYMIFFNRCWFLLTQIPISTEDNVSRYSKTHSIAVQPSKVCP